MCALWTFHKKLQQFQELVGALWILVWIETQPVFIYLQFFLPARTSRGFRGCLDTKEACGCVEVLHHHSPHRVLDPDPDCAGELTLKICSVKSKPLLIVATSALEGNHATSYFMEGLKRWRGSFVQIIRWLGTKTFSGRWLSPSLPHRAEENTTSLHLKSRWAIPLQTSGCNIRGKG